jgi:hypothetical protein
MCGISVIFLLQSLLFNMREMDIVARIAQSVRSFVAASRQNFVQQLQSENASHGA